MFPVLLDLASLKVVLVGEGEAAEKRLQVLEGAGAVSLDLYSSAPSEAFRKLAGARLKGGRPDAATLQQAHIVFLAGLDEQESAALAGIARATGRLVNTEDVKPLCDFHVPSIVRRGDLVISVSTGGKAPGLARKLRRHLEGLFGPEWAGRLDEVGRRREAWRSEGLGLADVGRRVDAYVEEKGWLP